MSVIAGETIPEQDAARRLGWGLRRYVAVIVLAVGVATGLALAGPANGLLAPEPDYEASALVVARKLAIKPEQLPRAAEAVFRGGAIAETVAAEIGQPERVETIIPDSVRLEPVTDTIALRVIGQDRDPRRAADLANAAAGAFVQELNSLGEGVGEFTVQDEARTPELRPERGSPVLPLAVGVISGGALGVGLVGLLLMVRRPLIDPREAATVAGSPLICTIEMPGGRRAVPPEEVSGLALLSTRMFPSGVGVSALVGCGRDVRPRLEILRLIGLHLARRSSVYLIVAPGDRPAELAAATQSEPRVQVLRDWFLERIQSSGPPEKMQTPGTAVLFGLSASDYDVPQLLPPDATAVILVVEGLRRARLDRAASQFGPGGIEGIAFVRRRRKRAGRGAPRAAARPAAPRPTKARPVAATPAGTPRVEAPAGTRRAEAPVERPTAGGQVERQPRTVPPDDQLPPRPDKPAERTMWAPHPDDQREPGGQRREVPRP